MANKFSYYLILFLFVLALVLGDIILSLKNQKGLKVVFLDVGQGDAILISEGQNQILIDGGRDGKALLEKLGQFVPFWDRQIEVVIATHPDSDHIGGLIEALKNYQIGAIAQTGSESDSRTYEIWKSLAEKEKAEKIKIAGGLDIKFPGGAELRTLYPPEGANFSFRKSNDGSVVAKLIFGENRFLFTGDLPGSREFEIINDKIDLAADILKVSHHGSKYSTGDDFLKAVKSREAVVSVGKNNAYGHPAPEVLERLKNHKAAIWRTDESGSIVYECPDSGARCQRSF